MLKHLQGWGITKKLNNGLEVYVCSFSFAKVKCLKDYRKQCSRENKSDHTILHVTKSNLSSGENAEMISKSITGISKNSLKVCCTLSISSTVPRNEEMNNKSQEVNRFLKKRDFINNSRFVKIRKHLNNSKPHLNNKG